MSKDFVWIVDKFHKPINVVAGLGMSLIIPKDFLSYCLSKYICYNLPAMLRKIIQLYNIYVCLYNVIILILVDVVIVNQ